VMLTTHPHLVPRSWKSRVIPLLPLSANVACYMMKPYLTLPCLTLHYLALPSSLYMLHYTTPHSLKPQEMEENWSLRQNSQAPNSLIQKSKAKRQSHNPLLKKSTDYSNNKRHTSFTLQANFQSDTQLSLINHSLKIYTQISTSQFTPSLV